MPDPVRPFTPLPQTGKFRRPRSNESTLLTAAPRVDAPPPVEPSRVRSTLRAAGEAALLVLLWGLLAAAILSMALT